MKHALWLQLLARLKGDASPLTVIDTHAGAGLYDLQDDRARRSQEAQAGVGRLMVDDQAPSVFTPLKTAVRAVNPKGELRLYPGSPLLTVEALRPGDSYFGYELRPDDHAALQGLLKARKNAVACEAVGVLDDGYSQIGRRPPLDAARPVYLVDPPFERGDEYDQIVAGVGRGLADRPDATFAIWAPLKDLETFDALLRALEALGSMSILAVEAWLRPMLNPMTMNGSAMIFVGAPDIEAEATAVCQWVVAACGEAGGKARIRKLGR
jgi:23S rRNA (adenine2030-N6)-methyltransferase